MIELQGLQTMKQLEAVSGLGMVSVTDDVSLRLFCKGDVALYAPQLAEWRNAQPGRFFTEFKATAETTAEWLRTHYLPSDELLFMIYDGLLPVGHLGLCAFDPEVCRCELGRVLRGIPNRTPGLMTLCITALLNWSRQFLAIRSVALEVFYDNLEAMRLYERCGFTLDRLVLFVGEQQDDRRLWYPLPSGQNPGARPVRKVARLVCDLFKN